MATPALGFRQAFRIERLARETTPRPPRTPYTVRAARTLARLLPRWSAVRTLLLSVAGFGLLTAAAWCIAVPLGLAAGGVSLLILESLSGSDRR